MTSKRQVKGKLGHVVQLTLAVCRKPDFRSLSIGLRSMGSSLHAIVIARMVECIGCTPLVLGTLSNDDDGNNNVKKQLVL